jgi:hypothetical protein
LGDCFFQKKSRQLSKNPKQNGLSFLPSDPQKAGNPKPMKVKIATLGAACSMLKFLGVLMLFGVF